MAAPQTITAILRQFLLAYPLTSPDDLEALAAVWVSVLDDVDDHALAVASAEYLKSPNEWRPVPGKLRARALELMGRDALTLAERAWDQFGDSDDAAMVRLANQDGDRIAPRAVAGMRDRMRRLDGSADIAEIMGERRRAFVAAYRELVDRAPLPALTAGGNGHDRPRISPRSER